MDKIISLEQAEYHLKSRLGMILTNREQATVYGMTEIEYLDLLEWNRNEVLKGLIAEGNY